MAKIDLETSVRNNHQAVEELLSAVRSVPSSAWQRPRAEGKWSPAQVAEHLALAYELSRKMVAGTAHVTKGVPPRFLQPIIRVVVRLTVLRTGKFPKAKAPSVFQPTAAPASQDVLCARLEAASTGFERDCVTAERSGQTTLAHPFFGRFGLAEYLQLQAFHAAHHRRQVGQSWG